MNKTLEEIRDEAVAKKDELIPAINNPSLAAIWWLLCNLVASVIKTFQDVFNDEKAQLEVERERKRYGRLEWYADEAKAYQYGDVHLWNSEVGDYYYPVIDAQKQIVARAVALEDNAGGIIIKVAKIDGALLVPLDANELNAFFNYMEDVKVSGTDIDVLSQNADVITMEGDVYYDGNYTEQQIRDAITEALTEYRDTLDFTGVVLKNDIISKIRAIPGVDDIEFQALTGTAFGQAPADIDRDYLLASGYFNYPNDIFDNWTFNPRATV